LRFRKVVRLSAIVVPVLGLLLAIVAPAAAAADSPFDGGFTSVSCVSVGNCTAVGDGQVTSYDGDSSTTSMAAATETNGTWGSVVVPPLPADAGNYSEGPDLGSVSCPAAGDCDASGAYLTNASPAASRALFEGERGGTWSQATGETVPAPANGGQNVGLTKISCGGISDCGVVVEDLEGEQEVGLLGTETKGTWGALAAPSLPSGDATPYLNDVSCSAPGECVAVGEDADYASGNHDGLLVTESGGTWGAGVAPPLPADAAPTSDVYIDDIDAVSCPATGSCTAIGTYQGAHSSEMLLLDQTGGSWRATTAVLPADSDSAAGAPDPVAVSCAAPGDCTAVGTYRRDSNGDQGPLLLTETDGSWGQGVTATPTFQANFFYSHPGFIGVSCGAPGSCAATFDFSDDGGTFILNESGGTWGPVVTPSAPPGGRDPIFSAISCPAAGYCTAVGEFFPSGQSNPEGLVLSESGGTWAQGTSPAVADNSGGSGSGGSGSGGSGGSGAGGGGIGGTQPSTPRLVSVSISTSRFVLAGRLVHRRCVAMNHGNRHNHACARKIALRVAYKLTIGARVTFTVNRKLPGRLVKGRCVKPSRKTRRDHSCTRLVPVRGSLTRTSKQGTNTVVFDGKIGGHKLGPGVYQLTIVPTANGHRGNPRSVSFQFLGAKRN
jgi:hypothetical protein